MKFITLGTGAGTPSKKRNNSASVLHTDHGDYVIDAGAPLTRSLIQCDIDPNNVRAVFITHMHEDHFGGLTSFLKDRMRDTLFSNPRWRGIRPEIWFPDADAFRPFEDLMAIQYRGRNKDHIQFKLITPGRFFDDGFLRVTAIPNRHIPWQDGFLPSYCLQLEAENTRIVCTGDLALDGSDFPVEAAKNAALCVSELTHFDPVEHIQYFKQIKPQLLVFNHVAASLTGKIPEFCKQVGYPVIVAEDGDEFAV